LRVQNKKKPGPNTMSTKKKWVKRTGNQEGDKMRSRESVTVGEKVSILEPENQQKFSQAGRPTTRKKRKAPTKEGP